MREPTTPVKLPTPDLQSFSSDKLKWRDLCNAFELQ